MKDFDEKAAEAVRHFWLTRERRRSGPCEIIWLTFWRRSSIDVVLATCRLS
jgi:hypothetical protein